MTAKAILTITLLALITSSCSVFKTHPRRDSSYITTPGRYLIESETYSKDVEDTVISKIEGYVENKTSSTPRGLDSISGVRNICIYFAGNFSNDSVRIILNGVCVFDSVLVMQIFSPFVMKDEKNPFYICNSSTAEIEKITILFKQTEKEYTFLNHKHYKSIIINKYYDVISFHEMPQFIIWE